MPQKRGIVKSGNAGNSSKSSTDSTALKSNVEKPLFPPGFKYPLSLLHERCQKEGWEKPIIDTVYRGTSGHSFVVTLARLNKKTSERETVRLVPPQPYYRESALEARHWGATYALYRFCNGFQLNRTLPPGPRDYWNELAVEHKNAADHLSWMYAADPFVAFQEVKARQEKAAQRKEAAKNPTNDFRQSSPVSSPFKDSPEVVMATSLREEVEEAIKEGFALYDSEATSALDWETIMQVSDQLRSLGFKEAQVKTVSSFLSEPSPLLGQFLQKSSFLETATEYLLLSVPECDLPPRFLPSVNSSNPFVSSVHSGTSDIKKRWMEEKAVKEAGFPVHIVQELTSGPNAVNDWPTLLAELGNILIGIYNAESQPDMTPFILDGHEFESLGGERRGDDHYTLPSFAGPITLHVLFDAANAYPRADYCPMYITSDTIPAYMRLHVLSRVLLALRSPSEEEAENSLAMTLMRLLDEEWARLEDTGPPDLKAVLGHMLPNRKKPAHQPPSTPSEEQEARATHRAIGHHLQTLPISRKKSVSNHIIETRKRLPAFKAKGDFLHVLSKNRVIIVPRRISAISVSNRVSEEQGNDGTVGYAVRGKTKRGKSTRLLFCTTGVVLRRLGNGDQLQNVSHVIVDEVHERSLDGDFLLLALKQLLETHHQLKVILMSATINHEIFSRYFNGAPVLSIPGVTHPVDDRYLEDIIPMIGYFPSSIDQQKQYDEKWLEELRQHYGGLNNQTLVAIHNLASSKTIDYQLIASLVKYIIENRERAGILIFLPGVNEIRQCLDSVNAHLSSNLADIFPLHANLPIEEQNRVFNKTEKWKIIAATNVAEVSTTPKVFHVAQMQLTTFLNGQTSITIDDIVYVIDVGKVKEARYSPTTDLTRIEETLVTKAASRQRRGRAGRMQPGVCYKLYTRHVENVTMEEFPRPEIFRVPLEQISLSAKVMNEDKDVKSIFGQLIDPPNPDTIERAWFNLQELGAIDSSNKLTPLGKHIAMLPLDVRLAKMLILGTIFHCLDPVLSIVALMSSKPLFISPEGMRERASSARKKFAVGNSDLLTDLAVFSQCQKMGGQRKHLRSFCKENFISITTLQETVTLRQEFCAALQERGFILPFCDPADPSMNVNSENTNLLKAIILGGLWPRVARIHLPKSAIKFDKIQAGTVQRDNNAKDFKVLDLKEGRVFIHPASILFGCASWRSPFVVYSYKYQSSKLYLRDATEVPIYALLLFGGPVSVDHVKGGLVVGNTEAFVRLRAWPRIGVLVNQLRQLLDLLLSNCIEDGSSLSEAQNHPVILAMLGLLSRDGMMEG
ncbi:hypothetical protein D9756_005876 [Leucocoprinus leucothites]|uniref:RNA helicase n=1 Tax=Leucocoprinus leucothites TaxID=201217 RepID=A0A8H5D4U0_9AGAR|nr:hypothetical protein D9756_005876 [Leucoagaricus leucothites]